MSSARKKTLTLTAASAVSSGWIPLNTHQMQYVVGYTIQKTGNGETPVIHLEGTLINTIANASVAATEIFTLASAPSVSEIGTCFYGEVTFPAAALRISTISGGSGASTIRLSVIESGLVV